MKAQVSIEYMIALGIFVSLVTYIYFQYISNINPFLEDVIKEEKRAEAFQISEILLNDPGEPIDWDKKTPERIGLANELSDMTNSIKKSKIDALDCSKLNDLLALERPFNLLIFDVDLSNGNRNILKSCISSQLRIDQINATVRRYAVYDGNKIAEIIVQV
ncbi:MAG: hypothetical protein QXJ06_00915 [Candidatus Aenigmatarchaeota archaeon]